MEIETSGSIDASSEHDDADGSDYGQDSDEEECGLADAFKQFEAQAEKRTQELLKATDEQLFHVPLEDPTLASEKDAGKDTEEGSIPTYVYMSDQFRLKKPPQFQHWQHNFQYMHVTGSRMQEGESMEHVQLLPTAMKGSESINGVYEEIILCDGVMEETLEHDDNTDDGESDCGKYSPYTSHVEEVLDSLTLECFSSTVVPMLTSFYKTMLEKQQDFVRAARVEKEAAANRTIEEQIAFEKTRQLRLDQEALEEIARVEELEKRRQEEERKEIERRELLLKQQLEENDEEEVKIKTLAYSHTREWYQPNKQCFSHRGRQLTYLKPVLQAKASEEVSILEIQVRSPPPSTDRRHTRQPHVLKKPRHTLQKSQPEWVTGGALTNDKLCDISWVKKIARPSVNPPPSPTRSRRRRKNENQKDDASSRDRVQLPIIPRPEAKAPNVTSKPSSLVSSAGRRKP
ncbi:hypothetical protein PC116_g23627 [Phytophthora cactorum]|uniref:Uncharacterized protein n=1 Tax=Phytophthora cactorum TaxID=29920 RepID=A0A8T1JVI0_9STRA|nr:hypothetical protein PC111_g18811 [Phytophthora cactorum]KAG2822379.1 hypothetical protein PC112_g10958 [Phytophthora cactorum]KAG2856533.1 hypothetical protein PC113_g11496 [Phytophthora cactorum]KAG2888849.1 hypothetical protein PC114_g18235 [Phytophthora cactorum]KAG2891998.1 hypothetical protein PC115_g19015 [Phytophthora cactorum]